MNILITSGGLSEQIDAVRKLTNSSTGKLGSKIANAFLKEQNHVTYICQTSAQKPNKKFSNLLKTKYVSNYNELLKCLKSLSDSKQKYDAIIHCMAVSDYTPVSYSDNNHMIPLDSSQKIDSISDEISIVLKKNPKIINSLKHMFNDVCLIGFKLVSSSSTADMTKYAKKQMVDAKSDLVVVNNIADVANKKHIAYFYRYGDNDYYTKCQTKKEIASKLIEYLNRIKG